MKVLGITGGVGAGKSTVLDYMESRYHARVIQADLVGHMVQEPGRKCYEQITAAFGTEILKSDGTICREKLASLVFPDPFRLQRLNQIVHPAVKAYITEEIGREKKKGAAPFMVIEAALLLEDHYEEICDEIWYIYADEPTRRERLKRTRGYSDAKVSGIMDRQLKEAEYRSRCKFVIDNSGNIVENTYEQIDRGLLSRGFL